MGYIYHHLGVIIMKKRGVLVFVFILGLLEAIHSIPAYSQKPTKNLSLLYSNNIGGEIEPCPT
jgi:hypothetical protein